MKRWNGWGHGHIELPIPKKAQGLLAELVGPGQVLPDQELETVLSKIPESRLQAPGFETDALSRLTHSRGQSLSDWIELRYGTIDSFPDSVVFPTTTEELRQVFDSATERGAVVIPYGGGTSVVGHLTPPEDDRPVLSLSLERLNRLIGIDWDNELATFQAGVTGPDLEATLRNYGFTLGHFPQSFELSTLGGWVVTRSSGQQSRGYGRIEDMFAGGLMLTPAGDLEMHGLPASAAGPDLKQLVMGSEGRMGVMAEVSVRLRRQPALERVSAVLFPDWESARDTIKQLARSELCLSMMRLSDPTETRVQLGLAGGHPALALLPKWPKRCLMMLAFTSESPLSVYRDRLRAWMLCRRHGGLPLPGPFGRAWKKNRFRGAYMRNTLWDLGYAVDTLETCLNWSRLDRAKQAIESGIAGALGERGIVFSHLSHLYGSGCSLYTTYLFPLRRDPAATREIWKQAKGAASRAIVEHGGTISHQHGVGLDHKPYLEAEKSALGLEGLKTTFEAFDPDGRMNPGKLL